MSGNGQGQGFNPEEIKDARIAMEKAGESFAKNIANDFKTIWGEAIKEYWFGNDGKNFINDKVNPALDKMIEDFNVNFETLDAQIAKAGTAWKDYTKTGAVDGNKDYATVKVNIDSIKDKKDDGFIGMLEGISTASDAALEQIKTNANTALGTFVSKASSVGFVGSGQDEAISACASRLKAAIENAIDSIKTELNEATKKAYASHATQAATVASSFSSSN